MFLNVHDSLVFMIMKQIALFIPMFPLASSYCLSGSKVQSNIDLKHSIMLINSIAMLSSRTYDAERIKFGLTLSQSVYFKPIMTSIETLNRTFRKHVLKKPRSRFSGA